MARRCRCAEKVNRLLAKQNRELVLSYRLSTNLVQCVVETARIEGRRSRPTRLVASFCPFCGVEYPTQAARRPAEKGGVGGRASKT